MRSGVFPSAFFFVNIKTYPYICSMINYDFGTAFYLHTNEDVCPIKIDAGNDNFVRMQNGKWYILNGTSYELIDKEDAKLLEGIYNLKK